MTGQRILVVDDRAEGRKLLALRLTREGYAVREAEDGAAALALAAAEPPDLVLLDVLMPGMDGFEVCRRLRAMPALQAVPVVMVTSLEDTQDCIRGLEAGADDVIIKPFKPAELQARVRSLLRVKQLHDEGQRQREALAELSVTLELRVAEGVSQVERLSRLKRFFSPALVKAIVDGSGDELMRPHRREIAVCFIDLRGFTAFADSAEAEEVMAVLAQFHGEVGPLVMSHEGTLERFTGDGMMVFFNDPLPQTRPAERAIRLALAVRDAVAQLSLQWRSLGYQLDVGIGIAQGYATIGPIGFEGRWDYAAIGSATNLAARLCAEAGAGQILISQRAMATAGLGLRVESLGDLQLKGFVRPVRVHWLLGLEPGASPPT